MNNCEYMDIVNLNCGNKTRKNLGSLLTLKSTLVTLLILLLRPDTEPWRSPKGLLQQQNKTVRLDDIPVHEYNLYNLFW